MANQIVTSFTNLATASAQFSCALAVFTVSQAGKVFKYTPTSEPTAAAVASFNATTETMKEQFDQVDNTVFGACNTVQQLALGTVSAALQPSNWTPQALVQTGTNLARWGIGLTVQLIPGGKIGVGGSPVGWGPVNAKDAARLSYGD